MKKILLVSGFVLSSFVAVIAQENPDSSEVNDAVLLIAPPLTETFHSTRIINGHSIETLEKGVLEFRIEHRFGDLAGSAGGVQNWFGFDNAADIRFAFEYGLTNDLMIGLGRSKGTGAPYSSLVDGFVKYKLLKQGRNQMPLSMTLLATSSLTYMKASSDVTAVQHFPKFAHRFAYAYQLNLARKFNERISVGLMPTYVHRNYVAASDVNGLFSLGGALKVGITPTVAVIFEYYQNFHDDELRTSNKNSFGVAVEWVTFGHNFTINLTNSRGFGETQFIPYTFEEWSKGQFRLGFCISRKFVRG